jgi:hypothetical protein
MRPFLRLNAIGALYGFAYFANSELWVNAYRIKRITGIPYVWGWSQLLIVCIYLAVTVAAYRLSKNGLGTRKIKHLLPVLWVPYAFILIRGFASLYPITDPQDEVLPAIGLVLLFVAFLYCFWIAFINFLASPEK